MKPIVIITLLFKLTLQKNILNTYYNHNIHFK